jgi:hypothetical protein
METDPITYKQLDELLTHLGFSRQHVKPKWLRYEHAASDTLIALVEKAPYEPVRVTDAVSARRHLVEKGLITEDALESMLSPNATPRKSVPARNR